MIHASFRLLALAAAPAVCAPPTEVLAAPPPVELRVRYVDEPSVLDWQLAATGIDAALIVNLMEGLLRIGPKGEILPALARTWSSANAGRTVTFKLRKEARWSDGKPVEAAHFVAAWRRLLDPETGAPYPFALFMVEGAEEFNAGRIQDFSKVGVRALAPDTLEIRLKSAYNGWYYNLTWWPTFPVRPDLLESHGDGWTLPQNLVTTGPWVLSSHDAGKSMVLARNPRHYERKGNVETLRASFERNDAVATDLFRAGKLDVQTRIATREGESPVSGIQKFKPVRSIKLDFNQLKPPMGDLRVRRAVAQGIDWSRLRAFLDRGFRKAGTLVPDGILGSSPGVGLKFDLKAAQESLRAAGYGPERPLGLELATILMDDYVSLTHFMKQELLQNLGIRLNVSIQPIASLNSNELFEDLGAYHAYLYGLSAKNPDPDYLVASYLSGSPNNHTGWKSAAYDAWIARARSERDLKARQAALLEAQKILLEKDVAAAALLWDEFWVAVRPGVTGFYPNHFSFYQFRELVVSR